MTDPRYEILRERHLRLLRLARAIIVEAEAVGDADRPMSSLKPHRLRQLRREVVGEPAPSGLTFMSIS